MSHIWVDIENRKGPPVRVLVEAKRPMTALRRALEQSDGPGLATVQGHPELFARRYANGHVVVAFVEKSWSPKNYKE